MFYKKGAGQGARALVVLSPPESKRLIARAVKETVEVKSALTSGRVVVIGGTTNAYVAEELTGGDFDKTRFAAGVIRNGTLDTVPSEDRTRPVVIIDGKVSDMEPASALADFTADDVYIKGANAVDPDGNAGVLMADDRGGTIGAAMGIINARGSNLIVPVGLEKLVSSVIAASRRCGQGRFSHATGLPVGMMPLVNAMVITELQAVSILFGHKGVAAYHIASGGVEGSEGSVVLAIEGDGAGDGSGVKEVFEYMQGIKGEGSGGS